MKKTLITVLTLFITTFSFAQCPDLIYAMVNACATGSTEGNNEFIVFKTFAPANVSTYKLLYGTGNPPLLTTPITNLRTLSGADAITKTGTGNITTSGGSCSIVQVTSPTTPIPANSTVIFIPANFDQNYDVTGLCSGSNIYVAYINVISGSTIESNWSASGTLANSPSVGSSRFLQVTYSGSASCGGSAPVKSYSNKWPANSDGNAVVWTASDTLYNNSGCASPTLPLAMIDVTATNTKDANIIRWRTVDELNTDKFILERSFDGKNFIAVSNIVAKGANSNNYQFIDKIIDHKTTYYRIKTLDKDGKYVYSRIVKVLPPSKSNLVVSNIYPNPAKENISIEWNSLTKAKSIVKIIDLTGRVLQTENTMALVGYNKRMLNVSKLPKGKYIIQISTDQDVVTTSFNK